MCGISGLWFVDGKDVKPNYLKQMNVAQAHRGPDDEDIYISGNIGLGHRRLSIIDLSKIARQPMSNENNKIWIVHNGEIFNYLELRNELINLGHVFKTQTDTEVIIHAYEQWGKECLGRFNGMWSFCIWDEDKRTLFISRDRFGIKPLYYFSDRSVFIFASEIKPLLATGLVPRQINKKFVYDYLIYGRFNDSKETFFDKILQIPPGHYMEIDIADKRTNLFRYWQLEINEAREGFADKYYEERLLELLEDSVRLRMRSDVPIGVFLSGGLDSTSVVCLMDRLKSGSAKTNSNLHAISNIYQAKDLDEQAYVSSVARKTKVIMHYAYPEGSKMLRDFDAILSAQEEPIGCARVYSQWEQFKIVKELGLKVILDGQGGDEILAGYQFFYGYYYAQLLRTMHVPALVKELIFFSKTKQGSLYGLLFDILKRTLPQPWLKRSRLFLPLDSNIARCVNMDFFNGVNSKTRLTDFNDNYSKNIFQNIIYRNLPLYLQPAFKMTDRTASYFSIECRSPFVDHRLVSFALELSDSKKIRYGLRKYILREVMKGILPEDVRTRTDKMQFPFEQDAWLRGHFVNYFRGVLNSESFQNRPFFKHKEIEKEFNIFLQRKKFSSTRIWRYMNLEIWMRKYIDRA